MKQKTYKQFIKKKIEHAAFEHKEYKVQELGAPEILKK